MGKILVVSHTQADKIDWEKAKKEVEFTFIRTQFGAHNEDMKHKDHEESCVEAGVPFGQFAFGLFSSVENAVFEAEVFVKNIHEKAELLMLHVEEDTLSTCGPDNLVAATQSFIDYCKRKGYTTGLSVPSYLYRLFDFNKVKADFQIITHFSEEKPNCKYDAWHYTNMGTINGYDGMIGLARSSGPFKSKIVTKMKRKRKG